MYVLILFFCMQTVWIQAFLPNNGCIGSRNSAERTTNYPLISGDNFRAFADHVYDEATYAEFNPKAVQPGQIVFLNTMLLFHYAPHVHAAIENPYILITHNSDLAVPDYHTKLLEDPKLIAWFGCNIMIPNHPKLHVIPLGVNNDYFQKTQTLSSAIEIGKFTRPKRAYLNFNTDTNILLRGYVWDLFKDLDFCLVIQKRSYADYLADMKQCMFVISPAGFGIDCHRHWEALLMGCIPVMKHSTIDAVFDDLPVILVPDWSMTTPKYILHEFEKLQNQKFNYRKLVIDFWFDKIRDVQNAWKDTHA